MTLFQSTESEVLALLPLSRIVSVLGRDPGICVYHNEQVKPVDLQAYNIAIMNMLYAERPKEFKRTRKFAQEPNYDEKIPLPPPDQVLLKDSFGLEHDVLFLHLLSLNAGRDLFLNDLVLANPFIQQTRELLFAQDFSGLGNGIFDEVLENIKSYARTHGFSFVSGHLSHSDRFRIFEKRGFVIDARYPDLVQLSEFSGIQIPVVFEV